MMKTQAQIIEELVNRALEEYHAGTAPEALEQHIVTVAQGLGVSRAYLHNRVFRARDDLIRRGF